MANKLIYLSKFIIAILLLPFIVASLISFAQQLQLQQREIVFSFLAGIISYSVLHLLFYEPIFIYRKGQRLVEIIFRFFSPLLKVAGYLLPIYMIAFLAVYFILSLLFEPKAYQNYFIFLVSFSLTFHLVLTAQTLRTRETGILKANYLFNFFLVYIANVLLLILTLNLILPHFPLLNFFQVSWQITKNIYLNIFGQLFLAIILGPV